MKSLFFLMIAVPLVAFGQGQHLAVLGGGAGFAGSGKAAGVTAPMVNVSAEGITPSVEVRLFPRFPISGGVEYSQLDLTRPDEQAQIPPVNGTGFITVKTGGKSRFLAGNLYVGGGTRHFRAFGFGTFGQLKSEVSTSYELHGSFKYQLPAMIVDHASQSAYGGGGGVAFTKGHIWAEIRVGYLYPLKTIMPGGRFGIIF